MFCFDFSVTARTEIASANELYFRPAFRSMVAPASRRTLMHSAQCTRDGQAMGEDCVIVVVMLGDIREQYRINADLIILRCLGCLICE